MATVLPRLRLPLAQAAAPHAVFPSTTALELEIGFGSGEHALARIAAEPHIGVIACEVFANGICSLLSRLVPDDGTGASLPANLRLWDADARILMRLLPDACLDGVYLLFPDPWPKARHTRRRFVNPDNIALLARVMRPGAIWRVASDDPTYQSWVDQVMAAQSTFACLERADVRPPGWPPTRYEAKALRAGRTPRYWVFARNPFAEGNVFGPCGASGT